MVRHGEAEERAARRYASFLVRCWYLEAGGQRVVVEHVQSGTRIVTSSPRAALAWMRARLAVGWSPEVVLDGQDAARPGRGPGPARE